MVTLKTMKEITIVSAFGALCTAMAVFVVAIQAPMDAKANPNPLKYTHDSVIWTGFPSALSTIAFSYGGINTYPHVEHAMAKPWQWNYAVAAGLSTCSVLYFLTAVPGYWSYGASTQSPIYASLPEGTGKLVAMIVMTMHVVVAVPIYTTTFSLETQAWLRTEERFGPFGAWAARAAIRTAIMVIVVILAVYIPYFGDFMSLIGALTNCGLVFLLPVLCYLRLTGWRNKPYYELAWCALILLLGVVSIALS
jgi:amino acid permease